MSGQASVLARYTVPTRYECESSSSSDSGSCPATPPLSNTPSSVGERTIKVAQFEDGNFTPLSASQPWLDISGNCGTVRTSSPTSYLTDSKNQTTHLYLASQFALNVAHSLSSAAEDGHAIFVNNGRGSYLWHADGYTPEPARVY